VQKEFWAWPLITGVAGQKIIIFIALKNLQALLPDIISLH
jgi:hypothetical protein